MKAKLLRIAAFLMGIGITSDYFRVVWLNIWLGHGKAVIGFTLWPWFEWNVEPWLLLGTMGFFGILVWKEAKQLRKPPVTKNSHVGH